MVDNAPAKAGRKSPAKTADKPELESRVSKLEDHGVETDEKVDSLRLREAQRALASTRESLGLAWCSFSIGVAVCMAPLLGMMTITKGLGLFSLGFAAFGIFYLALWAFGLSWAFWGLSVIIDSGRRKDRLLVEVPKLQLEYDQLQEPESGPTHKPQLVNC